MTICRVASDEWREKRRRAWLPATAGAPLQETAGSRRYGITEQKRRCRAEARRYESKRRPPKEIGNDIVFLNREMQARRTISELAVFDARLYIRVRRMDERA